METLRLRGATPSIAPEVPAALASLPAGLGKRPRSRRPGSSARQLAELGTPIYIRLDCSGKVTLKGEFPGAACHATLVLVCHRAGELGWMYDLLCLAFFPDIVRRWRKVRPAFWLKTSALRAPISAKLKEHIDPIVAAAEVAEIVRQGEKLRKQETVLYWSPEKTTKYWESQKSQNEKLDWAIVQRA